jgi:uncharacterized CHY-type Zn-finger protein
VYLRSLLLCTLIILWLPIHAQTLEEEAGVPTDSSDWDWSGFEAMDDTPVSSKEVTTKPESTTQSQRLTPEQTTAPDLQSEPRKSYSLFPEMPSFEVIASKKDSEMFPCKNCHEWTPPNPEVRTLQAPHGNFVLKHGLHGKSQFWCFTCHDEKDRQTLKTLRGEYVDFEEAYIICGQCHVNQTRDWAFGAHGKRVNNWKGKRQVYNCTVCHYQHDPTFKPRKALAGPEIRMGLERPDHWVSQKEQNVVLHGRSKPWQKHAESKTSGIEHE